ncbi:hypothetical protein BDR07DRAFT_1400151, partial [Suillus spraguei]
ARMFHHLLQQPVHTHHSAVHHGYEINRCIISSTDTQVKVPPALRKSLSSSTPPTPTPYDT